LVKARLREAFVGTSAAKFAACRGYSHHLTLVQNLNYCSDCRLKIEPSVTWVRIQLGYVGRVKGNGQSDLLQGKRTYNSKQSNEEKMDF
jgi:hypothetical protein